MSIDIGIILAIVAMLSWGVGDFLIQKSTRSIGNWETLFIITAFGAVVLLPFVWNDFPTLFSDNSYLLKTLTFSGLIIFIAALLEFEALREGKLSVVEPIWSLEIPAAALFAYLIIGETLTTSQMMLIVVLIAGLVAVSFRGGVVRAKHFLEKGALLAVLAAVCMGAANFFMGFSGRAADSLMANFIACLVMAVITIIYIIAKKRTRKMIRDIKEQPRMLLMMSIFDNVAWVAFVAAMTLAPIGIVVALTESYIIIVVILGLIVNKEKLAHHQKIGLIVAVAAAIFLATVSG
ncbi:MAG: DMT family transporter [Candidatus Pacebacteria bacterium]|nr:DMT family transporter [Candidatus Paceibacterota bacterium]MBP9852282.1 DMT family transporter [Candidatus Paceibacterota bacterium]